MPSAPPSFYLPSKSQAFAIFFCLSSRQPFAAVHPVNNLPSNPALSVRAGGALVQDAFFLRFDRDNGEWVGHVNYLLPTGYTARTQ